MASNYGDVLVAPDCPALLAFSNGTSTAKSAANIAVPLPGRMVVIAAVVVAILHILLIILGSWNDAIGQSVYGIYVYYKLAA
ncbi:hypothetical protein WOLCODRAFT_150449 [Wolfiporia cocos MD-104 SS10]|uniref:Uncharacterized protein n=1 Tax=Wolfiporia cocos (strain MD-104) TaxID=742152 RepID=A0A2H3JKP0_WOLCO|nr:hypothetical protein WOLCODRAFT_150449 [Wolfiporia cocos MD-104 SS10]